MKIELTSDEIQVVVNLIQDQQISLLKYIEEAKKEGDENRLNGLSKYNTKLNNILTCLKY